LGAAAGGLPCLIALRRIFAPLVSVVVLEVGQALGADEGLQARFIGGDLGAAAQEGLEPRLAGRVEVEAAEDRDEHANREKRNPSRRPFSNFEIVDWSIPVRASSSRWVQPLRWRARRTAFPSMTMPRWTSGSRSGSSASQGMATL
jgi:hypothetical protein